MDVNRHDDLHRSQHSGASSLQRLGSLTSTTDFKKPTSGSDDTGRSDTSTGNRFSRILSRFPFATKQVAMARNFLRSLAQMISYVKESLQKRICLTFHFFRTRLGEVRVEAGDHDDGQDVEPEATGHQVIQTAEETQEEKDAIARKKRPR